MKKSNIIKFILCAFVISCVFTFAGCLGHEHQYGEWEQKSPATCTQDEILIRYCAECDEYETKTGILAQGHEYDEWYTIIPASCTNYAVQRHNCKHCTHFETNRSSSMGNHEFGEWQEIAPATCTSAQQLKRRCKYCTETETKAGMPAFNHTYTNWATISEATCTSPELLQRYCVVCSQYENKTGNSASNHSFDDWYTVQELSCYNNEILQHTCSTCLFTETKTGALATGHKFTAWSQLSPPTCSKYEVLSRGCENCSYIENRSGTKVEHTFNEWHTISAATCIKSEQLQRECSSCNRIETKQGSPATSTHIYGSWYTQSATTCTAGELSRRDCLNCSHYETSGGSATSNHVFGNWITLTPATCSRAEQQKRTCLNCPHYETRLGSQVSEHEYGEWELVSPATCIKVSESKRKCNNCNHYQSSFGTIFGNHLFGEGVQVSPANCSSAEVLKRVCEYCSHSENFAGAPKTEHPYGEWKIFTHATCLNEELSKRNCTSCKAFEIKTTASYADHNYEYSVKTFSPTTTSIGYTQHSCICGLSTTDNNTCLITYESIGTTIGTRPTTTQKVVAQNSTLTELASVGVYHPVEYRVYSTASNYTTINAGYTFTNSINISVVWKTKNEIDLDSLIDKIEKLEELSASYKSSNAQIRVMQYIRQARYSDTAWNLVGGTMDSGFAQYVTNNQGNYNLTQLQTINEFYAPTTDDPIDFVHMVAIVNAILTDSFLLNDKEKNDLSSWAGDLCQLVQNLNSSGLTGTALQDKAYELFCSPNANTGFPAQDVYANFDAFIIADIYNSLSGSQKTLSNAMRQYYATLTSSGRKISAMKLIFSDCCDASGNLTKTQEEFANYLVNRTTSNTLIKTWCSSNNVDISASSAQFKAAAMAMAEYFCGTRYN